MPGLTTAAVVLMWIMFGLGLFGTLMMAFFVAFWPDLFSRMFPGNGSMILFIMTAMAVQGIAWAILRAVLAVKIARRSARARTAALVVESIGIAFQVAFAVVMFTAVTADLPDGNFRYSFDCTGIVLPILVLCFLSATRSRQWCDQ